MKIRQPTAAPNAEMARYWNECAGPAWVENQERLDAQIAPLGARARQRAAIGAGDRVLDVGCGCGSTTLEIARIVGPDGGVVAVDLSGPMLARARERALAAALDDRIEWRCDDAQTAPLEAAAYDVVFSRFGVMFFADPVAAFANLRRALRPGGRLGFVCWQSRERNPWMLAPALAAARHVAFPPPPLPDAPGPFAFADAERVRRILDAAGLGAVEIEAVDEPMRLAGETLDEAVALCLRIGPVGAALREANADAVQRSRVADAVREALAPFETPRGVEAPAGAWIVHAVRPG
jgi:SAM-dependent methyltransferase